MILASLSDTISIATRIDTIITCNNRMRLGWGRYYTGFLAGRMAFWVPLLPGR